MEKIYKEVSKEYLSLAEQDILASKILLKEKVYNLSVLHLSQAVEKITKSYCLSKTLDGKKPLFNFKELRKFHNPLDLLLGITKKYIENYKDSPLYEQIKSKIEKQEERIKKITGKESYKAIKKEIDVLKELERLDLEKIVKENYKVKKISKMPIEKIKLSFESFKEFFPLSLLGAISFKHYLSTRYPYETVDSEGRPISNIKFTEYKLGIGIVDALEELIKLADTTLKNFEKAFKGELKI